MHTEKIIDNVYSIGVLNPNLRVFDIVMKTDFGTSYNAYCIKGSEKTCLIETAHLTYYDYYLENLKSVTDVSDVDYIIINHCEPDHTGSLERLLDLMPNVTIITSTSGNAFLKNITNRTDMKIQIVKDGDTLSLGDKTLKFINAPFLHWPDSMFTYCVEDKILFSCDFLGSHYCEPQVIDTKVVYSKNYFSALKGYYDAIFGPFKPYVLAGLEKIKDLDIDFVATSHGPVLTKNGLLPEVIDLYYKWSATVNKEEKLIPIFYCSAYGNTRLIAKAIQKGILEVHPTALVKTYDIICHEICELSEILANSDGFLIGSPTLNKDAVAPVWMLLAHIDAINIAKRPVGLFGSYGWSGEAVNNIKARLSSLKLKIFEEDFKVTFVPTKEDLEKATEYGIAFAKII